MKKEKTKKNKNTKKKKKDTFNNLKSIYDSIQDKDKLLKKTILPIIFLGLLIAFIPFLSFFIPIIVSDSFIFKLFTNTDNRRYCFKF